jgi:hypothetical protein
MQTQQLWEKLQQQQEGQTQPAGPTFSPHVSTATAQSRQQWQWLPEHEKRLEEGALHSSTPQNLPQHAPAPDAVNAVNPPHAVKVTPSSLSFLLRNAPYALDGYNMP